MLTTDLLSLLLPLGPKQLEATLKWPVEVLWERPKRVATARLATEAAAERLVQAGLDLAAAVKTAYADLALTHDRERLAEETAALLQRIDGLTQSRLAAGDISGLEARAARVDAARARQDAARTRHDVEIARERLRALLGFAVDGPAFDLVARLPDAADCGPIPALLRDALVSRPDVRAAEIGVQAAAARLGWERSRILSLTAVLDANGAGREGFEMGPGIDIVPPLFDRNQAGRARADAELQRASGAYAAAQQRVASELREASAQYEQARESRMSPPRSARSPRATRPSSSCWKTRDVSARRASGSGNTCRSRATSKRRWRRSNQACATSTWTRPSSGRRRSSRCRSRT